MAELTFCHTKRMSVNAIFQQKNAIRKAIKLRLKVMVPTERERQSELVSSRVLSHPKYNSSRAVAVFLSMADEIETSKIIEDIFKSGKWCFIPRYDSSYQMTMVRIASQKDLELLPRTKLNIPQPLEIEDHNNCLKTGNLDLVLVPGLGFTQDGRRLGRGKGCYDQFLKTYCTSFSSPYTIGIALNESLVDFIPTTPNDICLDEILASEAFPTPDPMSVDLH